MQVFDENGKFLDQWPFATPSSVNFLYISADRYLWVFDDTLRRSLSSISTDICYIRGKFGRFPGGLFNMHGASVDQQGNLYIAEVANGRARNSARVPARIRISWWANRSTPHGNDAPPFASAVLFCGGSPNHPILAVRRRSSSSVWRPTSLKTPRATAVHQLSRTPAAPAKSWSNSRERTQAAQLVCTLPGSGES